MDMQALNKYSFDGGFLDLSQFVEYSGRQFVDGVPLVYRYERHCAFFSILSLDWSLTATMLW